MNRQLLKSLSALKTGSKARVRRWLNLNSDKHWFISPSSSKVLDDYVTSPPSSQNALDIFRGEWASRLPGEFGHELKAGAIPAFEDGRLHWLVKQLGGIDGMAVLELGPLEGGHTYMLERLGAKTIDCIEANKRAYLKCLIVKEILKLEHANFQCGDFVEYLRANQRQFDLCLASGVLYHMRNPVELIALTARASKRLFLWTHYYDPKIISDKPHLRALFNGSAAAEYGGFSHKLYRYEYRASLEAPGFCGGNAEYSHWLSKEDILNSLRHFDFDDVQVGWQQPDHANGPSFAILATRSGRTSLS